MEKTTKESDYQGFCEHLEEYNRLGIPTGLSDLRRLARQYNTPIPKLNSSGELEWPNETDNN